GVAHEVLVAHEDPPVGGVPLVGPLDDLGAVGPHRRLPAHQRLAPLVGDREGTLVERPRAPSVGGQPRVHDVAAVAQQEHEPRRGEEVEQEPGHLRARLLHDDHRVGRAGGLGRLGGEAVDDQPPQRGLPGVPVAVAEEVAVLVVFDPVERRQLGRVLGRGPGQRDRPPDAQVVAEVGVVDGHDGVERRQHPQQPGATAAGRAEDPGQPVLVEGSFHRVASAHAWRQSYPPWRRPETPWPGTCERLSSGSRATGSLWDVSSIPDKPSLEGLEAKWRKRWADEGTYRFDRTKPRDQVFAIDTPPPTVSGTLHPGHVCSYTHTDTVARYQRMRGKEVFYPMGWDDNGLNVERRVQLMTGTRCDPSLPYDPDFRPP